MNGTQFLIHEIGLDIQRDPAIPDALKTPFDDKIVALWEEAGNPRFPYLYDSGLIQRAMRVYAEAKGGSQ
jgi:hypothetical protein